MPKADLIAGCVSSLSLSLSVLFFLPRPGFKRTFRPLLRSQGPARRSQERGVCDRHQRLHAGDKDQTGEAQWESRKVAFTLKLQHI